MPPIATRAAGPSEAQAAASDEILVQRAVDGDVGAFRSLITRHAPLMRAYLTRILRSHADADDVLQETFVIAWRKLSTLRDQSHARAWLMQIATRRAFSHLGKPHRETELSDGYTSTSQDPELSAIRNAQLRALSATLDALPDNQRQCWLLREVAGLSYQDIADTMHISTGQARGNLARARANITIRMEGWR
ncbi:RNA polymerase sigma factor [Microbacterium sp. KSW2-21]|uniref:RNA polymerase sigma factor n=1 Tax=Microbacterium algihabitans TaxID=3075992 RepID=A0ABU3S037_9MICO|nr:RNA polymerase sigma factor [Microbacterium sp. KSW2-21]MDU0328473.1 RNA polymerase sigma factor [Microbacterium sp. KSW2-21]